ncbi:hypothetical protein L1987_23891 [Smallanthus sonchifolius]|uniref:Uncharacterized protein n=1 Tax=Smallanthus sonchifolius TaxID=185202 RepID=A0ACB9II62_9ASTR|nr:hypothetical protein L1987_23891 [Smallanthus sonchifolius]
MAAINHRGEEETGDSGHYSGCNLESSFKSRPSESSRWWTPEFERKVDNMLRSVVDRSDGVVDDSDLDLDEPQIKHLLQTAEAIKKDYPNEDWLPLTALIHDLRKVMLLPRFGELPQWADVGDTHPFSCASDESIVHYKYFKDNPNMNNPAYQTKNGIYAE